MKTMTSIILGVILFLQLGMSCKKEPILDSCTSNNEDTVEFNQDFELIWSVPDNRGFSCYSSIITASNVIYFIDPPGAGGDDIIALDKITGDTLWVKQSLNSTSKHKLIGNTLCYDSKGLVCINVLNGNEIWKIPNWSAKRLEDFIFSNNKIYAFFSLGVGVVGDSTKLYEINPLTGTANEKYTLYGSNRNGYNQAPRGMVFYQHPNGNEIIFIQSTGYKPSITSERAEYYAIDITNDSIYWDLGI
jgi:outer membrane protein assembly factor BamB